MTQQTFQSTVFVHKDKMFRFAKRLLDNQEDAFDTVQDVMMKLWQMKDTLHQYNSIAAFALRCTKNACLNKIKHGQVVEKFQNISSDALVSEHHTGNTKALILEMIQALPDKQKMVIHLKDVEEYSVTEIGDILEMDENAVRVNLMRARQKIKLQLEKIFEYDNRQFKRI